MRFDLKSPCDECPFRRTCREGWLGEARATQIAQSLRDGHTFICHKTGRERNVDDAQMCAGATLTMRRDGTLSRALHLAFLLRLFDPNQMNDEAPVFDSFDAFIKHHGVPFFMRFFDDVFLEVGEKEDADV